MSPRNWIPHLSILQFVITRTKKKKNRTKRAKNQQTCKLIKLITLCIGYNFCWIQPVPKYTGTLNCFPQLLQN